MEGDRRSAWGEWDEVFRLIEEREGRIVMMVERVVRDISSMASSTYGSDLNWINRAAAERAEEIRLSLRALRELTSRILGLSGEPGLLELTATLSVETRSSVIVNFSSISHAGDVYNVNQAAAVGPGSMASGNRLIQEDGEALSRELSHLAEDMRWRSRNDEHHSTVAGLQEAASAARYGDAQKLEKALRLAGGYALEFARERRSMLAAHTIAQALGLK